MSQLIGKVILSTGSWYEVLLEDGRQLTCRVKGKMRLKELDTTNPVAVGDQVIVELEANSDNGLITDLLPRNNYIIRRSPRNRKQAQIIAANVDTAMLIVTIKSPRTSFGFADRFLVNAEMYHIPAQIIINKTDLLDEEEWELVEEWKAIYEPLGYAIMPISAMNEAHIAHIKSEIQDKTILIAGHSGTGKSTLLNGLMPHLQLKTSDISTYTDKGMHTTTFAQMLKLNDTTFVIDTPGIKEFDILDLAPDEVGHYFPEFKDLMRGCRFGNCRHENEHHCAVKEALENGQLAPSRYLSYLSILDTRKEDFHWE